MINKNQTMSESDNELEFIQTIVVLKKTGNQDIAKKLVNERLTELMYGDSDD